MRTRLARRTTTTPNGTRVTTTRLVPAPELEWKLQAAGIRALRALPEFGAQFDLEGDFNAARRSMQESVKAKATGLTAGAFDVRIYMQGGRLGLIEVKAAKGRLSAEQVTRHADLLRLGFTNQAVIKVATEAEAAERFVATVREWLRREPFRDLLTWLVQAGEMTVNDARRMLGEAANDNGQEKAA